MRRQITHNGSTRLRYMIREIVQAASQIEACGQPISWENIGDPVQKGETVPPWIKEIVIGRSADNGSYRYVATAGHPETRSYLAEEVNRRGGCRITSDDILFFNGLGDAVSTLFAFLKREARVIGPSPAYSTLSSAEAAHSGYQHTTYRLDPENSWMPDLEDIENKVRYNDSIAGILLINPDNPTGAVYPEEYLRKIVDIARRYDLFVLADETYAHIVFNGAKTLHLSEVIGEVPGIALRSISKEFPWPGARCGWMEVFNQDKDENFRLFIKCLLDAKRLEVCSTSLPQIVIPEVFADPRYREHLRSRNLSFELRAREAYEAFKDIDGVTVNLPQGALYFTVLFKEGVLNGRQYMPIPNIKAAEFIRPMIRSVPPDKRFVYSLLASTGICVVPLTGFCSDLQGFRMTLLETDDTKRREILKTLTRAVREYLASG
ncbi:MAG: pyridoxal phosphate-dependent aminotransferase [Spirochaetia bacterium]